MLLLHTKSITESDVIYMTIAHFRLNSLKTVLNYTILLLIKKKKTGRGRFVNTQSVTAELV